MMHANVGCSLGITKCAVGWSFQKEAHTLYNALTVNLNSYSSLELFRSQMKIQA